MSNVRFTKGEDKYTVFDNFRNEVFYEFHYGYVADDMIMYLNEYEDKVRLLEEENKKLKKKLKKEVKRDYTSQGLYDGGMG